MASDVRDLIRDNIKFYRGLRGLTQQALAERCEVSTTYIGELEIARKYPSLQLLETMAAVLGIEVWQLFIPPVKRGAELGELLAEDLQASIYRAVQDTFRRHT